MPGKAKDQQSANVTPSQSQPSAIAMPIDVEQLVSEVPKGAVSSVARPRVQLTLASKPTLLKRRPTIGSYWLNTPLTEGAITVPALYKIIKGIAETYQRTHQDAFFAQYPDLIIQYPNETDWRTLSNSVMRANYKKWASRAAHHFWHFQNAACMYIASLANILVMSRINGTEALKTIASAFRWSVTNSRTNLYKQWYLPKSLEDYIFGNTKMAVGKSNHDAPFIAYPLWITDIYGNRGCHAIPFTNLQRLESEINKDVSFVSPTPGSINPDAYSRLQALLDNLSYIQLQYGSASAADVDTTGNKWNEYHRPHMPDPENGTTLTLGGKVVGTARLNSDGYKKSVDPIITSLWENYSFWQDYLLQDFSDFMDPESDWVNLFTKQLSLLKKAMDVRDALNIVHSEKNTLGAEQLLPYMTMKRTNKPNTATIIKWAPLINVNDVTNGGTTKKDPLNYDRYDIVTSSVANMLKESEQFPRLTPTVFGGEIDAITTVIGSTPTATPIVVNTIPGVGDWFNDGQGSGKDGANYAEPLGPASTLFDLACCNAIDPDKSTVFTIGAYSEDITKLIKENDAIMVEEYPTSPFVKVQPLIDTSDPFQCGFNVLLSSDTVNPSEWEEYLTQSKYFAPSSATSKVELTYQEGTGANAIAISNVAAASKTDEGVVTVVPAHTAIGTYLKMKKHTQVFVGLGLFTHPIEALMSPTATHGEMKSGAQPVASGAGMITDFDTKDGKKTHVVFNGTTGWTDLSGGPQAYIANSFFKMMLVATSDVPLDAVPVENLTFAATFDKLYEQALATSGNGKLTYHTFSPMYPPVDFARPDTPDVVLLSNSTQLQPSDSESTWGTQEVPTPQSGVPFFGFPGAASDGAGAQAYSPEEGYARREFIVIPRDHIYWFLEAVQIVTGSINSVGVFEQDPNPCVKALFATRRKQAAAILSHVITMFAGQEDMHPFWTIADMPTQEGDQLPTMDLIPKVDLMIEPRRQNAVGSQTSYKRIVSSKVRYRSETEEAVQSVGVSNGNGTQHNNEDGGKFDGEAKGTGNSASCRKANSNRSRKWNKGNRRGRPNGHKWSNDHGDEDHSGVKPDFRNKPINKFEGSPADLTSEVQDKQVRAESKKPVNPLTVMAS